MRENIGLFKTLNSRNIALSKDPQSEEEHMNAYYFELKEFGTYMYQLALQGKLFTLQKKDGDEYMRCVNAEKE